MSPHRTERSKYAHTARYRYVLRAQMSERGYISDVTTVGVFPNLSKNSDSPFANSNVRCNRIIVKD